MSSYDRSLKKETNQRLSLFGKRLQSLSDSFYSTILEDPQDKQVIKNADEFDAYRDYRSTDFTFDQCSVTDLSSTENFSFTFHITDQQQSKDKGKEHSNKHQVNRLRVSNQTLTDSSFFRWTSLERIVLRPPIERKTRVWWNHRNTKKKKKQSLWTTIAVNRESSVIIQWLVISLFVSPLPSTSRHRQNRSLRNILV